MNTNNTASIASAAPTWRDVLAGERESDYFRELLSFVEAERAVGKTIYPPNDQVFNALQSTPFCDVRVVILGQDPYIGPGQAHGLSFSVPRGVPKPPSLVNIFKEITSDLTIAMPDHGCLQGWAQQGVLLLNAVLTVEAGRSGSHANRGWERFTDRVIRELNDRRNHLVFLLWGSYAAKKCEHIDRARHCVLMAPHPSPLSAHRGFLGCKHFSQCNRYLEAHGLGEIQWGSL